MSFWKIAFFVWLGLLAVALLAAAILGRRPLRTLLGQALLSLALLAVIDLTSRLTGLHIPINEWTVASLATLGLPALIGWLVAPILFA